MTFQTNSISARPPVAAWIYLGLLLLLACWNTGLATDDFVHLNRALSTPLEDDLVPTSYVSVPFLQAALALAYHAFGDAFWAYGLLKAAYLGLLFFAGYRLFALWVSPWRAFLGSALFILNPLHDAATLWLSGQYLVISFALYFLGYVAAEHGRRKTAFILALAASFSSYGAGPLALFLGGLMLWRRRYADAAALLVSNAIYSLYYVFSSAVLGIGTSRLPTSFSLVTLAKSFAIQIASFVDAALGPSAILKIAYSLGNLTFFSLFLLFPVIIVVMRASASNEGRRMPIAVVVGAFALALSAFGLFALTGQYPQTPFNLADRVLMYVDFLLVVLALRWLPLPAIGMSTLLAAACFLGMGNHWARWNDALAATTSAIRANSNLARLLPTDTVWVSQMQYSRLGSMAHIDNFASNYVVREFFRHAQMEVPGPRVLSFNRNLKLVGNEIVDTKFGDHFPVGETIRVYDSAADTLVTLPKDHIPEQLAALPKETRHWTQLVTWPVLRKVIVWLMPSVRYAYE